MQSKYRLSKRSINKPIELKQWNGSTRVEKPQLAKDFLAQMRQSPDPRFFKNKYSRLISPDLNNNYTEHSIDNKSRNKSFITLEPTQIKYKNFSVKNSKVRSLGFRPDLDRKYKVPNFVSNLICEIFCTNNKEPVGLGVMIANKLLLSSYSALPNERFTSRCVFRFVQDKICYKPRTDKFFLSSPQPGLAVLAISRVKKDTAPKAPIRVEPIPELALGDILFCAESSCFKSQVTNLDQGTFSLNSHFTPLPGCPIFYSSWSLSGIALTTSMTYKHTECASLSTIFEILSYTRSRYNIESTPSQLYITQEFKEITEMKWFEFNGDYVETFNIQSSEWKYNQCQYEILWHCAPVTVNEETTILVGGIRRELAVDEVYKYDSVSNTIYALANMNVARAFSAAVFYDNLVFAIGGKYAKTYCEKYLIDSNKWEYIPSMQKERFDMSAVVLNHAIYVIGGEPRKYVGSCIEKFDILREIWELVPTRLPFPVALPPICVINNYSCGIFGGRGSKTAVVMEVSRFQSNDVSIQQGAELAEEIESIYPAVYSKTQSKIFILNTTEGFARPVLYKVHSSYLPL